MKCSRIVSLILVVATALSAEARGEWQTFSTTSGLAGSQVLAIYEDLSGNLWFGTNGGVSRFDGVDWITDLAGDQVDAITQDRAGNFWFGSYVGGVSSFDGIRWKTYTPAQGIASNDVLAITAVRAGDIWVGSNGGGASRFDGNSWRTYTIADGLANNAINAITEDRSGNLWFGTDGGVSRFDGASWRTYTTADGLGYDIVTRITVDHSGNLWFGTYGGGVSRFDGTNWRTYTTTDGLANNWVWAITEDRGGNLWFGTLDGHVSRFDGATWRTYSSLSESGGVLALTEDRLGNLWLGTQTSGVTRFDGASWVTYTTADGLASPYALAITEDRRGGLWIGNPNGDVSYFDGTNWIARFAQVGGSNSGVDAIKEDRAGNLWFGTYGGGVLRYDGTNGRTYTTADGLASDLVTRITVDHSGNLWFGTYGGGVSRFDGTNWRTYTTTDGLANDFVDAIVEDHEGNLWFGTNGGGVSRFDGANWRTYTVADGLANDFVRAITEDRSGNLWFATNGGGVSRFDRGNWITYLAGDVVNAITQDRAGNLWFGTNGGASSFDGTRWTLYTTAEGLSSNVVGAITEDRLGTLWFGTAGGGVTRYEADRVPPRTVFLTRPAPLSPARNHTASFVAAFGEARGIEFCYRFDSFDSSAWSSWSRVGSWTGVDIPDGSHSLEARSRDYSGNVDLFPPIVYFEVDATPPAPALSSPAFGQAVKGATAIRGTSADARFLADSVWVRPAGANSWVPPAATLIAHSSAQVTDGTLANWDTSNLTDGTYDIRLSVTDSLGLTGTALVSTVVDNRFPFVEETSPAKVTAASGGNLYTTNQELHLYFPPHAFDQDALVTIAAAASVTDTLPSGAIRVLPGYDVSWSAASLRKPATLALSTAGKAPVPGTLAVYFSATGLAWQRLGGTSDNGKVSLTVLAPGRYALFAESGVITGSGTLSGLAFTPRVFSPTGSFADREVGISFTLGRPAPVTVRVYSRSGRLIREVIADQIMNAGANLVRWDGRDRNGGYARDGMYIVTVEALGKTERRALAVVK